MGRRDCDGTKQSDIAIAFKPTASGKRAVIERQQKIGEVLLRPVDRQRTRPKQSSHRFPVFRNGLPENHSRGRHLRIFRTISFASRPSSDATLLPLRRR